MKEDAGSANIKRFRKDKKADQLEIIHLKEELKKPFIKQDFMYLIHLDKTIINLKLETK